MRNQAADLIGDELDGVFVIYTPINPFFFVDFRQQLQDGPLNIPGRREIFDLAGVGPTKLLVRDMKDKRMIRP